jgi:CheY-like chemotaxis protein
MTDHTVPPTISISGARPQGRRNGRHRRKHAGRLRRRAGRARHALAQRVIAPTPARPVAARNRGQRDPDHRARQPMAVDLRESSSPRSASPPISSGSAILPRTSASACSPSPASSRPPRWSRRRAHGEIAQEQLKDVLDAYSARDRQAARCRCGSATPRSTRSAQFAVPRTADLHDGRSAQHHLLHASAVLRQEHRAHRRPCTNIAETVIIYMSTGEQHVDERPKGEHDAFPIRKAQAHNRIQRRMPARKFWWSRTRSAARRCFATIWKPKATTSRRVARGDEAELRLKEHLPDLIVLDWMLPGLSGIELCRRLRARAKPQRLPVIMLTARGEEASACAALRPAPTIMSSSRSRCPN